MSNKLYYQINDDKTSINEVNVLREWLKLKRKEQRYSPKSIAEYCDITRNYYDLLESGKRNPSVAVAQKIATLLDFDWTLFFKSDSNISLPVEAKEVVVSK